MIGGKNPSFYPLPKIRGWGSCAIKLTLMRISSYNLGVAISVGRTIPPACLPYLASASLPQEFLSKSFPQQFVHQSIDYQMLA